MRKHWKRIESILRIQEAIYAIRNMSKKGE